MNPPQDKAANTAPVIRVTWAELPLSCPRRQDTLWSAHQRVYLPVHETGREQCPYCGTVYVLDGADEDDALYPNIEIERDHAHAVQRSRAADSPKHED